MTTGRFPVEDPGLDLSSGVPVSARFGDVYFSREDGLAETAHVFLEGCGLPVAWADRRSFSVGETGFGTGLNFLATWDLWRRHRPAGGVLHYVSVEGYPIRPADLRALLRRFERLRPLGDALASRYPEPRPGSHRIWFETDRLCLTLVMGPVEQVLSGIDGRFDAWFLDGFAPARNPEMWTETVIAEVARLSRKGARLATFTAAGAVRQRLREAGFAVRNRTGFGRKRDCTAADFLGPEPPSEQPWLDSRPLPADDGPVTVIGAGVAGAAMVRALSRRGRSVRWIDRHGLPAREASGNPVGILMPRPSIDPTPADRLSAAAFRHALSELELLGVPYTACGALELIRDAPSLSRAERLAAAGALEPVGGRRLEPTETDRHAGVALDAPAILYDRAGWLRPQDWVLGLAGGFRPEPEMAAAVPPARGGPAVVAAGAGIVALPGLAHIPIEPVRGQLTLLAETPASRALRSVVTFGGYISPSVDGSHAVGATYSRSGLDPTVLQQPRFHEDDDMNINRLPESFKSLLWPTRKLDKGARASLRAATPDRLPVAGPVPEREGLVAAYAALASDAGTAGGPPPSLATGVHLLGGLGSRGLVTAPLLAELVAGRMFGEPLPVDRDLARALHPARFLIRELRRRRI